MRRFILIIAICTGVLWGGPVGADETDEALYHKAVEAYNRGEYAWALDGMRILADKGDTRAQLNLGFMYHNGEGVPQDYAKAVKLFRAAAVQGQAHAQTNLAIMYRDGQSVPQDYAEAVK